MAETTEQLLDVARLGLYVQRQRNLLGLTQEDLHAAGGPATATINQIERGVDKAYKPSTLARLDGPLEWAPGSALAIARGREPTPASGRGRPGRRYARPDFPGVSPAMTPAFELAAENLAGRFTVITGTDPYDLDDTATLPAMPPGETMFPVPAEREAGYPGKWDTLTGVGLPPATVVSSMAVLVVQAGHSQSAGATAVLPASP